MDIEFERDRNFSSEIERIIEDKFHLFTVYVYVTDKHSGYH